MTRCLLSVHHVEGEETPASMEEMQPVFDAVDAFNKVEVRPFQSE